LGLGVPVLRPPQARAQGGHLEGQASPECKRVVWEAVSRILEEKAAELEEMAASG
jgi:hypothetical protein